MRKNNELFIRFINYLLDFFILNVSILIYINYHGYTYKEFSKSILILIIYNNLIWIFSASLVDLYIQESIVYFKIGFKKIIISVLIAHGILFISDDFILSFIGLSDLKVISITLFYSTTLIISRLLFFFLKKRYQLEVFTLKKVLFIGSQNSYFEVESLLGQKKELGYKILEFIDENDFIHDFNLSINSLKESIEKKTIDEVFIVKNAISSKELYEIVFQIDNGSVRVRIIPDFFKFYTKPQQIIYLDNTPVLSIRPEPLESLFNRMLKRFFDIVFSTFVILFIISWLAPLIIIFIKLSSPGPVFFKQKRSGRDSNPFICFKFRSMHLNENSDKVAATKNDDRVTRFGQFLRRTSLDELPQFFNVLIGNMSVVGPRPHMILHSESYSNLISMYKVRYNIKPGITGWAQVNGYRGEIKEFDQLKKRVEHDIWYLENWSILIDLQIILLTIYGIFIPSKNAY